MTKFVIPGSLDVRGPVFEPLKEADEDSLRGYFASIGPSSASLDTSHRREVY
jgi:hypothetical protein